LGSRSKQDAQRVPQSPIQRERLPACRGAFMRFVRDGTDTCPVSTAFEEKRFSGGRTNISGPRLIPCVDTYWKSRRRLCHRTDESSIPKFRLTGFSGRRPKTGLTNAWKPARKRFPEQPKAFASPTLTIAQMRCWITFAINSSSRRMVRLPTGRRH